MAVAQRFFSDTVLVEGYLEEVVADGPPHIRVFGPFEALKTGVDDLLLGPRKYRGIMDYVSVLTPLVELDVAGNDPFDIEHFGFDHISPDLLSFFRTAAFLS
jgi:hypothetical protein